MSANCFSLLIQITVINNDRNLKMYSKASMETNVYNDLKIISKHNAVLKLATCLVIKSMFFKSMVRIPSFLLCFQPCTCKNFGKIREPHFHGTHENWTGLGLSMIHCLYVFNSSLPRARKANRASPDSFPARP